MITNLQLIEVEVKQEHYLSEDVIELEEIDEDLTTLVAADRTVANYQKTGDLITLPYTETTFM